MRIAREKQEIMNINEQFQPNINDRIFFVDTAYSIKSKKNKIRYWKSVIVENNELVAEFANSKVKWANAAETYAILSFIFWAIEKKITSTQRIILYSDNLLVVDSLNGIKREHIYGSVKFQESSYHKYMAVINKLIKDNNIDIVFKWVKGVENPADYYSRNTRFYRKIGRSSKKLTTDHII